MDLVAAAYFAPFKHAGKDALSGHDTVTGHVKDGASIMALFAYLADLQQC